MKYLETLILIYEGIKSFRRYIMYRMMLMQLLTKFYNDISMINCFVAPSLLPFVYLSTFVLEMFVVTKFNTNNSIIILTQVSVKVEIQWHSHFCDSINVTL